MNFLVAMVRNIPIKICRRKEETNKNSSYLHMVTKYSVINQPMTAFQNQSANSGEEKGSKGQSI